MRISNKFDPENTLVVPIACDALVVNEKVSSDEFRRWRMNFFQLDRYQDPKPNAFEGEIQEPFKRVSDEADEIYKGEEQGIYLHWKMPVALKKGKPNDKSRKIEFKHLPNRWLIIRKQDADYKSWLIRSDEFHKIQGKGSTFYKTKNKDVEIGKLGNSNELVDGDDIFSNPAGKQYIQKLDAMGFGDPGFLAYQPLVNDIFSFHDNDLEGIDVHPRSYFIVGWYSNKEKEALHGDIEALLKEYDWNIAEGKLKEGARSLYYCRIYDVKWKDFKSPKDEIKFAHVSLGNHPVDALIALFQDLSPEKKELLKAFLYGDLPLLNNTGGRTLLEQEIRRKWFSQKHAGSQWSIELKDKNIVFPNITEDQKKALEQLNIQQNIVEKEKQNLYAYKRLLHEANWRLSQKEVNGAILISQGNPLTGLKDEVIKQQGKYNRSKEKLEVRKQAVILSHNQKLTQMEDQSFYHPYDPVVLLTGIKSPKFEKDKTLECLIANRIESHSHKKKTYLPFIKDESFRILFNHFLERKDEESHVWKEQPWDPLFIEWEIEWYPIPFEANGESLWTFDGVGYEINSDVSLYHKSQIIRGRNFIGPQNNELLIDQLNNFKGLVDTEGESWKQFEKFVARLSEHKFLTQHLENFNNALQMRNPQLGLAPNEGISNLIGDEYFEQTCIPKEHPDHFEAIRQGQFKFNKLIVYDAFGQTKKLVGRFGMTNEAIFDPRKDKNLQPEKFVIEKNTHRFLELKPRINEYARLKIAFADAFRKSEVYASYKNVNPIAGWLICNHLNKGLSFFDSAGNYLGEIRIVQGVVKKDMVELESGTLRDFIKNIPLGVTEFEHFLWVVDETLWTIDAHAGLNDKHLSVIIGRPLAIIRTRFRLEVEEYLDAPDQNLLPDPPFEKFENAVFLKKRLHEFLEKQEFEVRLGSQGIRQDGLIGYFSDDGSTFNSVVKPAIIPPQSYIQLIGTGNFIKTKFHVDQGVTILADPRTSIYAQTGILPAVEITLPLHFVDEAMTNMEIPFRFHTLLTTIESEPDPNMMVMNDFITIPHPTLPNGKWYWDENEGISTKRREIKSPKSKIPDSPALIREGFLTLTKALDLDKSKN